jgi:hypothetical protein
LHRTRNQKDGGSRCEVVGVFVGKRDKHSLGRLRTVTFAVPLLLISIPLLT